MRPAINACLIFFTAVTPKYNARTYNIVSQLPAITAALLPISESTPYSFMISSARMSDPLPEIGRKRIRLVNSFGIPVSDKNGSRRFSSQAIAPDAVSAFIAIKIAIIKGRISMAVCIPSLAPSENKSYTGTFLARPWRSIMVIITGMKKSETVLRNAVIRILPFI